MFDPAFYKERMEKAIFAAEALVATSKSDNTQIWYILQGQLALLRDYADSLKQPQNTVLERLEKAFGELKAEVELLKAHSGVRTVGIGKTTIGGAG
jgi:hypothetical protein